MLIDERTSSVRVALHTDSIAGNAAVQALFFESAMWIVAIAATHEPLVHLVMEGLRKGRLYIGVAGIAELGL
jgi:hypothetical protein